MYLDELSNKIWATKNSRFVANKRIKRRRYGSFALLSLFSVFIVGINLLVFIPIFQIKGTEITILTIIVSTLILVGNQLMVLANYQKREDDYLKCGKELDALNQKLQIEIDSNPKPSKENQIEWVDKYQNILNIYEENHTDLDYEYFDCKYKYKKDTNKWFKKKLLLCSKIYVTAKWFLIDINVLIVLTGIIVGIITYLLLR